MKLCDFNTFLACVVVSWSVTYDIQSKLLKIVVVALANPCSCRDMLSATSLVDSKLVPHVNAMEDAVIEALSRKCPRSSSILGRSSKDVL